MRTDSAPPRCPGRVSSHDRFQVIRTAVWLLLTVVLISGRPVVADTLTIAVAANFAETLQVIADSFEQSSGHQVRLVRGSSGRHYAQIMAGAPFDLFFSADAERPAALAERLSLPDERVRTYANGRLVLWGTSQSTAEIIRNQLNSLSFRSLAIANPRLAPYGQAAMEVLAALNLVDVLESGGAGLVRGESVAQAYQYVASGNAELGFVALSQVVSTGQGAYWLVPEDLYRPITQELLILKETTPVQQFIAFLDSESARRIIELAGYRLP